LFRWLGIERSQVACVVITRVLSRCYACGQSRSIAGVIFSRVVMCYACVQSPLDRTRMCYACVQSPLDRHRMCYACGPSLFLIHRLVFVATVAASPSVNTTTCATDPSSREVASLALVGSHEESTAWFRLEGARRAPWAFRLIAVLVAPVCAPCAKAPKEVDTSKPRVLRSVAR